MTQALAELAAELGSLEVAALYLTEPVSDEAQPDYWNTAAVGTTRLRAEELLAIAQRVEERLGRRRERHGAPRTLDIDLLLLGAELRNHLAPLLPHPRLRGRRFVLAPLAELAPDWPLPPDGATPAELLARLPERPWVRQVAPRGWPHEVP